MVDECGAGAADGTAAASVIGAAEAAKGAEAAGPPFAECVLCRAATEYPESHRGITLCPVCEWQEAQRTACSG
ncbi:hypothetical protein [Streptomyces sp. TS71-3]|uniref:hypothetical protein n=1 Tax=Streptomyces sp. TS71-3 TaxID=2733862 RepID=UPI001B2A96D6|nr:hypothetical protein [Streptomyces sp. TS71-3]GHJ40868.1 hypothetical protein Sm713_64770 [Streptomyces sp. TS71-3]